MTRGMICAAVAAVVLSILLHALGLGFISSEDQAPATEDIASDVADVGSTFEDLADIVSESAEPEPASVPDPPSVTSPDLVIEETPTTQALVASDDPQDVTAPDTGTVDVIEPDAVEPTGDDAAAPETAKRMDGEDDTVSDTAVLAPLEPKTETQPPNGTETENPDPTELQNEDVPPAETVSPIALAPASSPSAAIVPEPEVQQPVLPEITIAPEPDDPETVTAPDSEEESSSAVTTSLRPPKVRPSMAATGARDASRTARSTGTVESPLAAYNRTGIDPFASGGGGARSGTTGFSGSRNPGNASAFNYAGQVLVQLNRFPSVDPSVRGSAQVAFGINPDGTVAWVNILSSTGHPGIRRAAVVQVRRAAPFPPPPEGASQRMVFTYQRR